MKKIFFFILFVQIVAFGQGSGKRTIDNPPIFIVDSGKVLSNDGIRPIWVSSLPCSQITGISATLPIRYTGGNISISKASNISNGYLSSDDFSLFSAKQNAIIGDGFVKANGSMMTFDNTSYLSTDEANDLLDLKVDKIADKGLSTNDFSTTYKNDVDINTINRHSHTNKSILDNSTASFLSADRTKLDGIATGATANSTDAQLRDRGSHTGTQAINTVSDLQQILDSKQASLTAGQGINISSNVISSVITSDTTTLPPSLTYRLALTSDSSLHIVNSVGKVYNLINRYQPFICPPTIIDSTLSSYTIIDNKALNFVLVSTQAFSDATLGKYNVYSSNLHYYIPKHNANYTISINLPNPTLYSSVGLAITITMNKRCIINFNYPIYYTLRNATGNLIQDTDYGSTQMTPTLQTIPSTTFKATWFVSYDSTTYVFYVHKNKWFIK